MSVSAGGGDAAGAGGHRRLRERLERVLDEEQLEKQQEDERAGEQRLEAQLERAQRGREREPRVVNVDRVRLRGRLLLLLRHVRVRESEAEFGVHEDERGAHEDLEALAHRVAAAAAQRVHRVAIELTQALVERAVRGTRELVEECERSRECDGEEEQVEDDADGGEQRGARERLVSQQWSECEHQELEQRVEQHRRAHETQSALHCLLQLRRRFRVIRFGGRV